MNEHMNTGSSNQAMAGLSMFLAGVAIGAAAALVLAPSSGSQTRAYLKRRTGELAHDAVSRGRDAIRTQSDRVTSALATGWRRAGDAFRHGHEEVTAF